MQNNVNENQPKISFVIPCKNRGEFLLRALKSLQQQTVKEWEAIVVDDYSDTDLKKIIDSLNDARIILVKNKGKAGISGARNYGNTLANSDLIAVADSDDINLPRRIEVSLAYFDEHPETDLFYANIYCFNHGSDLIWSYNYFAKYNRNLLYERDFIPHGTVVYRKEVACELKYDESINAAVDYDILLKFANQHKVFGFTEEPLMLYRRHSEQISTDQERRKLQENNAKMIKAKYAKFR